MWSGIVTPATAELEQDVRALFLSRKIDLGGKTLDQYLEHLRIAVTFHNRECRSLRELLRS
jgi:puromycin-sensitive aminopeptidase